jgi:RNA polymerase sigma-70 factor (ECF subfamily)
VGGPQDDAVLVALAQAGDNAAFAVLVARYQQMVGAYLLHLTGERELARDLSQDTFVRAYRALPRAAPDLSFRPWLYRIATNLAHDYWRRQRLYRWLPVSVLEHHPGDDTTAPMAEQELVRQVLARLKPEERAVLLLCGLERLPYSEAAAALGSSAEAIRKRFARAKDRFRAVYAEQSLEARHGR